jgi:RNA polymerase sigma-54 factor
MDGSMLLQKQSPSLRPQTTAHLAQTMSLLELTLAELRQNIDNALSNNPALEMVEQTHCPNCGRPMQGKGSCAICFKPSNSSSDEPIVFLSTRSDFYTPRGGSSYYEQDSSVDEYTTSTEALPEYVLKQIAAELKPDERIIAAHILTSLDDDGLLSVPIFEISRYRGVPLSKTQEVLRKIQHAEPLGVGSPSPQDAMKIQLEVLKETKPVPEMAVEVIEQGLNLLSRRKYTQLARKLGIAKRQVLEIANFISDNLNPFPGRSHWGEFGVQRNPEINAGVYYAPDIIISRLNDKDDTPLVVEIAMPIRGSLRINPLFVEALEKAPPDKVEDWKADLEQATLLVKCLQQRNHTMVRMLELLTKLQREFILYGDKHLIPMTRSSLSKILDLHESTISRAVSDKAVQLPNGKITPLSRFFDRSLHIRTVLKQIIDQEKTPLSDNALAKELAQEGYSVARRTVAKYRSMEGILPAHLRVKPNSHTNPMAISAST